MRSPLHLQRRKSVWARTRVNNWKTLKKRAKDIRLQNVEMNNHEIESGRRQAHMSTGSTKKDKNSSNSIVPLKTASIHFVTIHTRANPRCVGNTSKHLQSRSTFTNISMRCSLHSMTMTFLKANSNSSWVKTLQRIQTRATTFFGRKLLVCVGCNWVARKHLAQLAAAVCVDGIECELYNSQAAL